MTSCSDVHADVSSLHRCAGSAASRSAYHYGGLEAGQPRDHLGELRLLYRHHIRLNCREPALELRLFRAESLRVSRHDGRVATPGPVAVVAAVLQTALSVVRAPYLHPHVGAPPPVGATGRGRGLSSIHLAGRGRGAPVRGGSRARCRLLGRAGGGPGGRPATAMGPPPAAPRRGHDDLRLASRRRSRPSPGGPRPTLPTTRRRRSPGGRPSSATAQAADRRPTSPPAATSWLAEPGGPWAPTSVATISPWW